MKKPTLSLINPDATGSQPPRKLGQHGTALWRKVQDEYGITDIGDVETLMQICAEADRAEELAAQIDRDGSMLLTKHGPKENPLIKHELAARAFVVRGLAKLGLNVEPVRPVGRPPGFSPPT